MMLSIISTPDYPKQRVVCLPTLAVPTPKCMENNKDLAEIPVLKVMCRTQIPPTLSSSCLESLLQRSLRNTCYPLLPSSHRSKALIQVIKNLSFNLYRIQICICGVSLYIVVTEKIKGLIKHLLYTYSITDNREKRDQDMKELNGSS